MIVEKINIFELLGTLFSESHSFAQEMLRKQNCASYSEPFSVQSVKCKDR